MLVSLLFFELDSCWLHLVLAIVFYPMTIGDVFLRSSIEAGVLLFGVFVRGD